MLRLPPANILLVEDGDTNRKLIRVVLGRAGAKVTCAVNGQIGVELASERSFDLILMDMQMPVMDGYTATARLRQQGVTVPIIALTAHAMTGDREKCELVGCSGYLTKPVEPDELLRTVAKALGVETSQTPEAGTAPAAACSAGPELRSSLPADDPDFREIVEEFVERLHEKLQDMQRAWEAQDLDELAQLAHWLKGAGGTAGFPAFTEPARRLGAAVKAQQSELIESALREVADLVQRIVIPWEQPGPTPA